MANYKNLIPFIRLKEGGLSSAQTDNAKKNPSPCGKGNNGYSYHTNKGVTWLTFISNAKVLGYEPSCSNFIKMPNSIWELIYKKIYWDSILGDKIMNQAIANTFVEWAWGSGVSGALSDLKDFFKKAYNVEFKSIQEIVDFSNKLNQQGKTPELFESLYNYRIGDFKKLNQPANIKGWLNRLSSFYSLNKPYALSKPQITSGIIIGALAITFISYKIWKANK